MGQNRREFLKRAAALGAAGTAASSLGAIGALGPLAGQVAAREAAPSEPPSAQAVSVGAATGQDPDRVRGMAHGLTLLSIKRNSATRNAAAANAQGSAASDTDGHANTHALEEGQYRLAAKTPWGILDVAQAAKTLRMHAPSTMDELLQNEDGPSVNALITAASRHNGGFKLFFAEERLEYGPIVARPEKIICVGLNYRRHAALLGQALPKQPVLFNKYNNALNGHYGTITLPPDAKKFDYGVALVIVMGKEAKNVSEGDALAHVAGYSIGNDFSARDLQLEANGGQWMVGKTLDQFAPLGPYMVTADQVNPDNLMLECRVNGETRQSSATRDFVFSTRQIISYISRYITLKPGDIIFTGTPEGVIQTKPKEKQVWLKGGDQIACSVEKLGELKFQLA